MDIATYLKTTQTSQASFAARLGVAPTFVWQLVRNMRPVPIERCAAIETVTGGAVTRKDLRPDDWQAIWPELAERTVAPTEVA